MPRGGRAKQSFVSPGDRFGDWTVVAEVGLRGKGKGYRAVLCKCSCGAEREVNFYELTKDRSHGCKRCSGSGAKTARWKGHGPVSGYMWGMLRRNAAKRGLRLSITIEDAAALLESQQWKCALSGCSLTVAQTSGAVKTRGTASLDRIDNERGYEPGNVQWVHKDVNKMKTDFSDEEFIAVCCLVADHHRSGG